VLRIADKLIGASQVQAEERVKAQMAADLSKRLAELKAKRQVVEQAIAALQQLQENRDKEGHRISSSRRPAGSLKTTSSRRTA
jgi:hypothetical protein